MVERKKKKAICVFFLLLAIGVVSFFYWGNRKQVWFCDEIYSYQSANGFEQEWPDSMVDTWMTGEDVEAFFSADSDTLSLDTISMHLYSDHVPLFFWLFRMVSFFFFRGSGTLWIGLWLNLFFYVIVLWIGYKLFLRLTGKAFAAGVIMVITGVVNRLMLEQALTLRMYMMLLWAEMLLVLGGLWILRDIKKNKMSTGVFPYLFVVSVIGFLIHYDYWIFYAVTAMFFCMWILFGAILSKGKLFWRTLEFRCVLAWIGNFGASLWTTMLLFPYCKWNLNRDKGQMAIYSIFDFSAEKIDQILWGFQRLSISIFGDKVPVAVGLSIVFGCIVGGAIILYRRKTIYQLTGMILIVLISLTYQVVVCFTFPAAWEERYLWGTFTLVMWCAVYGGLLVLQVLFQKINAVKVRQIGEKIVYFILVLCIMIGQITVIDGGNGIAYLFHPEKNVALLEENSHREWIVYGPVVDVYSYYDWMLPEQICFLSSDNTPEDATAVRRLQGEESFVLYVGDSYLAQAIDFLAQEIGRELEAEYLTKSTNLTVYLIRAVQ